MKIYSYTKNLELNFTSCCEQLAIVAMHDSPAAMLGKNDRHMPWRDRRDIYIAEEQKVLAGMKSQVCQFVTINNENRLLCNYKSPLVNKYEKIVGIIGSSIDVTDIHITKKSGEFDKRGNLIFNYDGNSIIITKSEILVLKHLLRGMTATEIAQVLHRSVRTIEGHIASLRYKFQAMTKGDIIFRAYQMGLMHLVGY